MIDNIALVLAILYLIYRFKTYKELNNVIEERIENVYKPFHKRVQNVLECSEEDAEKVAFALSKYFVPVESEFYKVDDSNYLFVDAGGFKGTFSIDQNYNIVSLIYNDIDLLSLHKHYMIIKLYKLNFHCI